MRVAKTDRYDNSEKIVTRKIGKMKPLDRTVVLTTPASEKRFVNKVEKIVRGSLENQEFTKFLKTYIDMNHCSYFNNVTKKGAGKVSIHIHHEPFTLFDICLIVFEKWKAEDRPLNHLKMAEEITLLHYQGKVGLIPLSDTVHKLVHCGKIFIPLHHVAGKYVKFVEEYGAYIPDEILEVLEVKVQKSKHLTADDTSILETKFVYLDIDGNEDIESIED